MALLLWANVTGVALLAGVALAAQLEAVRAGDADPLLRDSDDDGIPDHLDEQPGSPRALTHMSAYRRAAARAARISSAPAGFERVRSGGERDVGHAVRGRVALEAPALGERARVDGVVADASPGAR